MIHDVITVGSAVCDTTFYTDQGKIISTPHDLTSQRMLAFEYGGKINTKEAFFGVGGGAANAAATCARLGLSVAALVRVGDDESGRGIMAHFKKQGIGSEYVQKDREKITGFSFIVATDKKEKEHIVFTYRGANDSLEIAPNTLKRLKTRWLYVTSLSGKKWLQNSKTLFDFAAKSNIKIMWNPGSVQLGSGKKILAPMLKNTEVLMVNKDEAIELVLSGMKLGRKNPNHLNRPLYLLNILREWGPKIVIITEGKRGAWAYDGNKIYRQAKITLGKEIDTTGVGDAFGSGFLAGFHSSGDCAVALKWGALNSGSVIGEIGAQNGILTKNKLTEKL